MSWLAAAPNVLAGEVLLVGFVALLRRRAIGGKAAMSWAAASLPVALAVTQLDRLPAAGLIAMSWTFAILGVGVPGRGWRR